MAYAPTISGSPFGQFGGVPQFGGAPFGGVAPTAFGAYGAPTAFGGYGAPLSNSISGLTALSGVVAPGHGNLLNAGQVLAGGYSGYGAGPVTGTGAGYSAASYIPPPFGPSGFNASGLSSWSGYSAGTATLAPQAVNALGTVQGQGFSGYGGLASTAPLPWGATVAGIPGYGAFGGNTAFNPNVIPSTIAQTAGVNAFPGGRVAPAPPTIAPAGYE
jgi:hypothetical protein